MNHPVQITWLGHSCFRMEYRGWCLITDAYADGSVPGLPPLRESADAVCASHGHGDHIAPECVKVSRMAPPPDVAAEEFSVPHDHHGGAHRGANTVRQFRFGDLRVVHMGDTGCMPDAEVLSAIRGCDVLLLPVGGFYTVDASEAKAIAEAVVPRCIVPMHYRGKSFGYDVLAPLEDFTGKFDAVTVLPGAGFTLTEEGPAGVVVPSLAAVPAAGAGNK